MRKIVLSFVALGLISVSCSKDDDGDNKNCDACTSDLGNKFEICDNGDGTYSGYINGILDVTFTEGELEGLTPKEVVERTCAFDSGEDL